MKNADFKIYVLAMMIFCLWLISLIGCKQVTPPPPKPNSEVDGYTLYHTGEVENIYYYEKGSTDWFCGVQINFVDGHIARLDRVKSFYLIKNGDHGKLYVKDSYKDRSISGIQYGDFTWVKSEEKKTKKPKEKITTKFSIEEAKIVEKVAEVSKQYEWIDASYSSPNVFQLVLIKLDNKIITTGRFNENNEWQIETDKGRKSFNKYPSFKVVEWKEL